MTRSHLPNPARILLIAMLFALGHAQAQEADIQTAAGEATAELRQMLEAQQLQLTRQEQKLIELERSNAERTEAQQEQIEAQQKLIEEQRGTIRSMQADIDRLSQFDPSQLSEEEIAMRNRLETLEESISKSQDASSTTFDAESFPGSIPIPGSTAAIKIGGFVKANMAMSFDTIGSEDRFIVGSIPTDPVEQGDSEVNLTVSQSRLNFDLRDQTQLGVLRAFIEADFAAEGDVFRLRHAFGQFRDLLIGKTDSAFVDTEARPEELDFEGINGAINVRQTQVRAFPQIGKDWNLIVSLEDPNPDVQNGDGISKIPDLVLSVRRTWFERWHIKTGILLRNIQARWDTDTGVKDDDIGWGVTFSGKTAIKIWNENDNFLFQFNAGSGYGRYINDLASVGGGDAVFDPNGNLKSLPIYSGYVAFQHWWNSALRSTFITSIVHVDNYSFQSGDSYRKTQRISGNVIWSPAPRIDLGTELIWGTRTDNDRADGKALQWQMSVKYRF